MTLHILKITNRDDYGEDPQYYTIKKLRDQVISDWYDCWVDSESETEITKENILESDEKLFDFMDEYGFNVEFILTITEDDLPKRTDVIEVDVSFYHPNDDESVKVYDEEGMREEFEYKLDCLIRNSGL